MNARWSSPGSGDWKDFDPREMSPEQFREVRNLIEAKVKELLQSL